MMPRRAGSLAVLSETLQDFQLISSFGFWAVLIGFFPVVINTAVGSCDVLLALIGKEWVTIADPEDPTHTITHTYLRDYRPASPIALPDGTPSSGYNSHEVLAGTAYDDYLDGNSARWE